MEERVALGLPSPQLRHDDKQPKKKRIFGSKAIVDRDLELAFALSRSFAEQERKKREKEEDTLLSLGLHDVIQEERRSLSLPQPPPLPITGKGSRGGRGGKKKSSVTVLQMRTKEERERIITEKVATLLVEGQIGDTANPRRGDRPPRKPPRALQPYYDEKCSLWNFTSSDTDVSIECYFVPDLCDYIKPENRPVGDLLKSFSEVPGRMNYTALAEDSDEDGKEDEEEEELTEKTIVDHYCTQLALAEMLGSQEMEDFSLDIEEEEEEEEVEGRDKEESEEEIKVIEYGIEDDGGGGRGEGEQMDLCDAVDVDTELSGARVDLVSCDVTPRDKIETSNLEEGREVRVSNYFPAKSNSPLPQHTSPAHTPPSSHTTLPSPCNLKSPSTSLSRTLPSASSNNSPLHSKFVYDWSCLLANGDGSDVSIVTSEGEINAHTLVLTVRCPNILKEVEDKSLYVGTTPSAKSHSQNLPPKWIDWSSISYESAYAFMVYIYSGVCVIESKESNIWLDVFDLSLKYKCAELVTYLEDLYKSSSPNKSADDVPIVDHSDKIVNSEPSVNNIQSPYRPSPIARLSPIERSPSNRPSRSYRPSPIIRLPSIDSASPIDKELHNKSPSNVGLSPNDKPSPIKSTSPISTPSPNKKPHSSHQLSPTNDPSPPSHFNEEIDPASPCSTIPFRSPRSTQRLEDGDCNEVVCLDVDDAETQFRVNANQKEGEGKEVRNSWAECASPDIFGDWDDDDQTKQLIDTPIVTPPGGHFSKCVSKAVTTPRLDFGDQLGISEREVSPVREESTDNNRTLSKTKEDKSGSDVKSGNTKPVLRRNLSYEFQELCSPSRRDKGEGESLPSKLPEEKHDSIHSSPESLNLQQSSFLDLNYPSVNEIIDLTASPSCTADSEVDDALSDKTDREEEPFIRVSPVKVKGTKSGVDCMDKRERKCGNDTAFSKPFSFLDDVDERFDLSPTNSSFLPTPIKDILPSSESNHPKTVLSSNPSPKSKQRKDKKDSSPRKTKEVGNEKENDVVNTRNIPANIAEMKNTFQSMNDDSFLQSVCEVERNMASKKLRNSTTDGKKSKLYKSKSCLDHPSSNVFITPDKRAQNVSAASSFKKNFSITPLPDYKAMLSPELKKELDKYGIRKLSRKKAVTLLVHIYDQMHPLVTDSEAETSYVETPDRIPLPPCGMKAKLKPSITDGKKAKKINAKVSPQKANSSEDVLNSSQSSVTSADSSFECLEETAFPDPQEEEITATQQTSLECRVMLYIRSDCELHRKVLSYDPIWANELHQGLKANGVKCGMGKLIDFLDEQCITFRLPTRERTRKRPRKNSSPGKSPRRKYKKSSK